MLNRLSFWLDKPCYKGTMNQRKGSRGSSSYMGQVPWANLDRLQLRLLSRSSHHTASSLCEIPAQKASRIAQLDGFKVGPWLSATPVPFFEVKR
jgi:hypothetical protein